MGPRDLEDEARLSLHSRSLRDAQPCTISKLVGGDEEQWRHLANGWSALPSVYACARLRRSGRSDGARHDPGLLRRRLARRQRRTPLQSKFSALVGCLLAVVAARTGVEDLAARRLSLQARARGRRAGRRACGQARAAGSVDSRAPSREGAVKSGRPLLIPRAACSHAMKAHTCMNVRPWGVGRRGARR